ncbi:hypothetical protein [Pyxidicoccus sp. MSG2]|uniref:hypothetical protein n=1 Tax=Pyxidicoccus sp. MSG2 TaxID=2996790 RepID=UPI0022702809|nr:hypothetical protein [Pyxidicoccus sp. MSG2]MCY1019713.1 hypothetical protein [Pyxidicoccus sp. MSG2]
MDVEELATSTQEVGACDETRLAWTSAGDPANVCAVPWQYGLDCNKSGSNITCGARTGYQQKTCYHYPVCRLPQFGIESRAQKAFSQSISCPAYSSTECRPKPQTPDIEICTTVTRYNCYTQCHTTAQAKINSLPAADRTGVSIVSYNGNEMSSTSTGSCSYTLSNWPTYNDQEDPACGAATSSYSCDDTTKPIYPTCRHNSFGNDVPTACNADPLFAAAGTTLGAVKQTATNVWGAMLPKNFETNPLYTLQPLCRTCDQLALNAQSGQTQVTAKYDCLLQGLAAGLPAGAGGAQLRSEVVSRLKLLYELHSHHMTPAQVQYVRGLYQSDPAANTTCSAAFVPPTVSGCGLNLAPLNAAMDLCTRLASSHVPGASARSQMPYCVGLASQVAAVSAGACQGDVYREKYHGMWLKLYERALSDIHRVDVAGDALQRKVPDTTDVRLHLQSISDWYAVQRAQLFPGAPDSPVLMKQLSETFDIFWKVAYENALLNVNGLPVHAKPLNAGLLVDQTVLTAVLTGSPAMSGPPLLMLLGDGFNGLFERMEDFSYLHDLGCRFKGCGPAVDTETAELFALFGAVPDAAKLQTAVGAANKLNTSSYDHHAEWVAVFNLLRVNHAAFTQAVVAATGAPSYTPELLEGGAGGVPAPLAKWAQMVEKADAYADSYLKSGFFVSTARDTLKTGIEEYKSNFINDVVTARKNALTTAVNEYTQNRTTLINEVLGEVGNAANQKTVQTTLVRKLTEFYALNADLVGLQDNLVSQEAQFSDIAAAFNTTLDIESPALGTDIQRGPLQTLNVSAADAHGAPGALFNVLTFAVHQPGAQAFSLSALHGELLNFDVSGEYAPSCALSSATIPDPATGTLLPVNTGGGAAQVGPGGYMVSYSNGAFTAQNASTSTFTRESTEDRACAGVRVEAGFEFFGSSTKAYASAETCNASSKGSDSTSASQNGSEGRTSASFATGLRVPGTPFPDAPVGSLLLVAMNPGTSDLANLRDVRVLQAPRTSVVVKEDADYYLVVNDFGSCADDTAHQLTVTAMRLMPTGVAAKALGKAMATVMTEVRAATPAYVDQGRVTNSELEALRSSAQTRLLQEYAVQCPGCSSSQMPEVFGSLFTTFVNAELARLERLVQLRTVERAIDLQLLDIQSLGDDLTAGADKARLLRLLPLWRLRNLDGAELRDKSRALTSLVTDYLYPTMDLRHPTALAPLKVHASLDALVQADWSDDFAALCSKALTAVGSIETALANARISDKAPKDLVLAFAFPNPYFGMPLTSQWRSADSERSEAVWNSILNGSGEVLITLTPDDLYSTGGVGGTLLCNHHMPVIKNLGVQVVRPFSSTNASDSQAWLTVPVRWEDVFAYPATGSSKHYAMLNPDFLVGAPHLLFGQDIDVLTTFAQDIQQPFATVAGNGLSPFGTFTIGLGNVSPEKFAEASALVVTLKVDALELAATATGAAVCQ